MKKEKRTNTNNKKNNIKNKKALLVLGSCLYDRLLERVGLSELRRANELRYTHIHTHKRRHEKDI
jgi:hypothetical protein